MALQAYAANYTGHGKIDRLICVADKSAGQPMEVEALKMAVSELQKVLHGMLLLQGGVGKPPTCMPPRGKLDHSGKL